MKWLTRRPHVRQGDVYKETPQICLLHIGERIEMKRHKKLFCGADCRLTSCFAKIVVPSIWKYWVSFLLSLRILPITYSVPVAG